MLNSEEIQCGQKSESEQRRRVQPSQSRAYEISQPKSGKRPKGRPMGWRKGNYGFNQCRDLII